MDFTSPLNEVLQLTFVFQESFALNYLLAALLAGFILSFAVGANDSANSWGTPVGAGTVSIGAAFVLGSLMETMGAVFLSGEVVATIAGDKSVVNMDLYESNATDEVKLWQEQSNSTEIVLLKEKTLMLGLVVSMVACQTWQLIATYLAWPVSGTHTIISALLGFTLVEKGITGVNAGNPNPFNGSGIFKVIYGLLVSPTLTLFLSFGIYSFLYRFAVKSGRTSDIRSKVSYSSCVFLITMAITFTFASMKQSPVPDGWDNKAFGLLVGLLVGALCAFIFYFLIVNKLIKMTGDFKLSLDIFSKKKKEVSGIDNPNMVIEEESRVSGETGKTSASVDTLELMEETVESEESDEIKRIFRPLQILAACFGALTHGSNDVGNCVGPLVKIWYLYQLTHLTKSTEGHMYGILLWGGIGISVGLVLYGERVIVTMGTKMTKMTSSLGFTVVLSASLVVMICSVAGIPTSTTHCQVMGVVGAGVAKGWSDHGSIKAGLKTIDFVLMRNIALSWIVTIPFALALSSMLYAISRVIFIGPF